MALAAVVEIGLPPKVETPLPRMPSRRSPRPTTPPIANPLPRPLANVMKSGVTSCAWIPQKCSPVRPQPVCTSSEMSRMPCSSRTSLYALNRPLGAIVNPPTPWIGSAISAPTSLG